MKTALLSMLQNSASNIRLMLVFYHIDRLRTEIPLEYRMDLVFISQDTIKIINMICDTMNQKIKTVS